MWRFVKIISAIIIVALFPSAAFAWTATGHALTAHIASTLITPETLKTINGLLSLSISFPSVYNSSTMPKGFVA